MDTALSARIANDFLDGAFSTLDALLGGSYSHKSAKAQQGSSSLLDEWCIEYPVWMYGTIQGGGAVAILWPMQDAAALVARVGGEDPATRTAVTAEDAGMLQELADAVVGGGASGLSDLLGSVVLLDRTESSVGKDSQALRAVVGPDPSGVVVEFEDGGSAGTALFVYSRELVRRIAGGEEPLVSNAEVKDILKDFTPDDESEHGRGNGGALPENLEVVMDIELVATARLGNIEVPIADVLNYGPGSIIELGHMVDEPVELLVNGKLIARGDVVVVDEKFGLRITEIVSPRERIESLR